MDLMGQTDQKQIMDKPVVSFCIATFQRLEILKELVNEILSVQTDKLEVVVCDDRSLDGSVEKLKEIKDVRLRIYVNEENVGSSLNIHDSLDRGNGKYLFYVNDRDNVDNFKIEKLIEILEDLEEERVAFAKCIEIRPNAERYHIFDQGRESLFQFACRIDHPTGYIFKRDVWKKIKNRRVPFENQDYGDYPITQICAIMARKHKGALIYGDICDLQRYRIDFSKMKSGYYLKRKDKRLWYTPEVIFRELVIGQKFLRKIGVEEDIRREILVDRYAQYLPWCVTDYKKIIEDPVYTAHYDYYPNRNFFYVFINSMINGLRLWIKMVHICMIGDKQVLPKSTKLLWEEYKNYFGSFWGRKKVEYEICKREAVLATYENWVDNLMSKRTVSEYFEKEGYYHVAIYGMGRIGKSLLKEFDNSDVCVDYIIDQKMSRQAHYYENIPCLNIEAELPDVDFIIVTVPSEASKIINELKKKVKWTVKSIDDILFVVN